MKKKIIIALFAYIILVLIARINTVLATGYSVGIPARPTALFLLACLAYLTINARIKKANQQ